MYLARIPALSWVHPRNGAAIIRCSQPMTGLQGVQSRDDEDMVESIRLANSHSPDAPLIIMDARPKINATANAAQG